MGKKILMPFSFISDTFCLLIRLSNYELDEKTHSLCNSLESEINNKFSAWDRRESFSRYKAAAHGSDERERYRCEYLNKAGIHKDWRSDIETSI